MASGDTLFVLLPVNNMPPTSAAATFNTRNNVVVLEFDATTDEEAVFSAVLPHTYKGGGLTCTVVWMAATATTGNVVWQMAIEAHPDDSFDIDADGFAALNGSGAVAAPSATGEQGYDDITFTDGADMDSWAAGESGRVKIRRDADDTSATDSMSGDAQLLAIIVKET